MVSRINLFWLRHRWWVVSLAALALVALEFMEHRPRLDRPDPSFLREILVSVVAILLAVGWLLGGIAHRRSERVGRSIPRQPETAGVPDQVLVVENEMLGGLVKNLLDQTPGLTVTGHAPVDQAELVREIERIRPQVVVLSKEMGLIEPTCVLAQVKDGLDLRLIVLSLHDNAARIYDRRQAVIGRSGDLAAIIRSWAI